MSDYTIEDTFDPSSPYYNGALYLDVPPSFENSVTDQSSPSSLGAGELQGDTTVTDGFLRSQNYAVGSSGWILTPTSGEFNFAVSVDSLDIPDTTTANSFHVDTSGNAWWGVNTAGGYATASAYVLDTGAAFFSNVKIGGSTQQYQITDNGIFSFGDGSNGSGTCDGSSAVSGMSLAGSTYTMTQDVYFSTLTINSGITVKPSGYRIFVAGTLTINGTIDRSGNNGSDGANGADDHSNKAGGAGGAALADGYLKGSAAGTTGATSLFNSNFPSDSSAGASTLNSIGTNGSQGGGGGGGPSGESPSSAGSAGGVTAANVKLIANWHLATLLDISSSGSTVKFDNSAGSSGGGAGGRCATNTNAGGGGGGAGSAGGIIAIYARVLVIGATGVISANGGNGGNGGNGWVGSGSLHNSGGGGGGAGANGGQIILVYNSLTNSGSITVTAGTKGTGGTATAFSTAGSDGNNGTAGTIRQFQLSL